MQDNTADWDSVAELTFTSPATGSPAAAVNGNLTGFRTHRATTLTLTDPMAFGDKIWIRFRDDNLSGDDHGLAVDDFQITPLEADVNVPEPATVVLLAIGLCGLATFARRRRG